MTRSKFCLAVIGIVLLLIFALGSGVMAETTAGSTGGKLAVTPVGYDDMGSVLKKLGVTPEEITYDQMASLSELEKYDAVYINCAGDAQTKATDVSGAIKNYVDNGGIVYASDWAADIIAKAFPGKINFYQGYDNSSSDDITSSHVGDSGSVNAKVVDSGLASVLGKTAVTINYDLPAWVVVDSAGAGARVLMTGDVPVTSIAGQSSGGTLPNKPLVLDFSSGKGEVVYTTFHNEAQLSKDVEAIINWFGVRTQAGRLLTATRNLVVKDDNISLQEIVDAINKDETKTYYFNATGEADFSLTLNFGGSTLGLTITDPTGAKVASQDVSKPPFTSLVPAKKGKYAIQVVGKDVSSPNYPFVLLASGPRKAAADEIIVGQGTTTTSSPAEVSGIRKFFTTAALVIGIGVLVVILIIVLVIVLIVRASRRKSSVVEVKKE